MTPRPLAIASAGAFIAAMSTSLVAVAAPVIARDLGVTPRDVSWVLSAYLLAISSLLALSGRAADLLGRKRIYLTGLVFFAAGSAMCASAPRLSALIGARVVQGVGAAMLMALGPAIVTRAVPPAKRARALGVQLAATYAGLTLGPSVGGLVAGRVGWHAVFVIIAGAGAIGFVVAAFLLPADDQQPPARGIASLDLGGGVLLSASLVALLLALKRAPEDGWTSMSFLFLFGGAAVAGAVFVRHEALHSTPLLPLALFRQGPFAFGVLGSLFLYTMTMTLSYLLPFQLQRSAGLGPAAAGAFMTAQPAVMAIVAPIGGQVADRWGARLPGVLGMLALASGMALVAYTATSPGAPLVVALSVVGAGAGLYIAPNSALIMGSAPRERQGVAGAMVATARNVGMTLGIALAASLDHALGFRGAVLVAAALGLAGALLAAVRPVLASPAP